MSSCARNLLRLRFAFGVNVLRFAPLLPYFFLLLFALILPMCMYKSLCAVVSSCVD